MKKITLLLLAIIIGLPMVAVADSSINLTPVPMKMTVGNGKLVLPEKFTIAAIDIDKEMFAEAQKFGKLWIAAEVLLFVLVGAAVDLHYTLAAGPSALLLILLALVPFLPDQNVLPGEVRGPRPAIRGVSTALDTWSVEVSASLPSAESSEHMESGIGLASSFRTWLPDEAQNLSGTRASVF